MHTPINKREEKSEKKLNTNMRETSKSWNACYLSQFDGAEIIHREDCRITSKARGSIFIDST
jgi:hypothetical protein